MPETAVGRRAAQALVEEQEPPGHRDAFGGERVGGCGFRCTNPFQGCRSPFVGVELSDNSPIPPMKKLINSPESLVAEAMDGLAAAFPELLRAHHDPNFLVRVGAPIPGKAAVISGGGSGHEPLHGGFVGRGMLDAACPGAVFTSPTPDQMLEATKAVNGGRGVLHIVKNYTGDVLNFEMAAELARSEGIEVEAVVIDDDVAVKDSLYTAGRRGVGTTVLAEKVCGAAAEASRPLGEIAELCRRVNRNGRSMGMALTSCTVPHVGKPTFELGDDEMEIGIGIHGEPGRERMKLKSADEVTDLLLTPILEDLSPSRGSEALLFVNGMGGTPLLELFVVFRKAHQLLKDRGVTVARSLVGPYITSLEMAGTSLTLLRLDDELKRLWDAPVHTPALRWAC
jgi:dihydroxyacetone kinase-like protein